MKQVNNRISDKAGEQLDMLTKHFESQRVALEMAINDAHQKYIQEVEMVKVKKCRYCGQTFDTRLVDVAKHEERCQEHQRETAERNINRLNRGQKPKRNP